MLPRIDPNPTPGPTKQSVETWCKWICFCWVYNKKWFRGSTMLKISIWNTKFLRNCTKFWFEKIIKWIMLELWPVKGFLSVQYKVHLMTSRTWIMIKFLKNLELECNSTNPNKSVGSLYLWAEIIVKYWKPRFSQFFAYSGGFLKNCIWIWISLKLFVLCSTPFEKE